MSQEVQLDTRKTIWDQPWLPSLVFGLLAAIYLVNRSPYVGFNDGLTFLYFADNAFDPATNATSHFLYINLLRLLQLAFYFVPTVLLLTLFSIGCTLGTLYIVYRAARLLSPTRPGVALLPVLLLGMAFTFWQQTEIIEVYAFNNLIFAGYLSLAMRDLLRGNRQNHLWVSLLVGVGLLTHIQHILALPFLATYLCWRNDLKISQKLLGMAIWMGLMSTLFILPLLTHRNTLGAVFIEKQFRNDLFGLGVMSLLRGLGLGIGMLVYNFHLGLVPIGLGWRWLWKAHKGLLGWLMLLLGPWLAFALKYSVNDNHVFYLIPYLILVLPTGLVLETWLAQGRRHTAVLIPVAFLLPITLYATATLLAPSVPALQKYDSNKSYKGGVVHLLWPGKSWAKDPLEIALREAQLCQHDPANQIQEWNFKTAVQYLKANCKEEGGWTIYPQLSALAPPCFFDCPDLLNLMHNSER
jgi:Protein of unknown function (DUF2723)